MKRFLKINLLLFFVLLQMLILTSCGTSKNGNGNYDINRTSLFPKSNAPVEEELFSFSTPIKSDDPNRLINLKITSSRINGTVVKAGKEFSFYETIGEPSSKDGYKEADAYGHNNTIIKVVGGGNCQISTTIYNAVLGVKGLEVTERHEHDMPVAYIEDGKDATVSYGSLDLKFKNNNDFDIKIYSQVRDNNVTVKIVKIL